MEGATAPLLETRSPARPGVVCDGASRRRIACPCFPLRNPLTRSPVPNASVGCIPVQNESCCRRRTAPTSSRDRRWTMAS